MSENDIRVFRPEDLIRAMVRGTYDMQKLRVMMGNRITQNFKTKLGVSADGLSVGQEARQQQNILKMLRTDYDRLTDGIIAEGSEVVQNKLPRPNKFKPHGVIDTFAELSLIHQYVGMLQNEECSFKNMEQILKGIPIYDNFLKDVDGLGVAMAAVIISEIDIRKSQYASSIWKYAGLDTVTVGSYMGDDGKVKYISPTDLEELYQIYGHDANEIYYRDKKVEVVQVGRSRQSHCLELREYVDSEGELKYRRSITFNHFLKTKVLGVLGASFLKSGKAFVDGKRCGAARRLEMAVKSGFDAKMFSEESVQQEADLFLRDHGHEVIIQPSTYGKVYYDYKNRLENMREHQNKTRAHRHNMAIRYAVKRFFVDLYTKWRTLEGLPVATEYSEGKLGLTHGVASASKENFKDAA